MSFGLFLSAICSTENAVVQTAIAVFYPNMLLSGKGVLQISLGFEHSVEVYDLCVQ